MHGEILGEIMFPNLRAEMVRKGITVSDISRVTHKTDKSIRNKLNGVGDFTLTEVINIRNSLFPDIALDLLFKR